MLVSESKISSEDVTRALAYYLSAEVFKRPVTVRAVTFEQDEPRDHGDGRTGELRPHVLGRRARPRRPRAGGGQVKRCRSIAPKNPGIRCRLRDGHVGQHRWWSTFDYDDLKWEG